MNQTSSASKTKRSARISAVCLATFLALFGTLAASAQTATPEDTAKSFYKWYMHELNANRDPVRKSRPKMRQFISARLATWTASKAYVEYDADYFIDAQDFAHDWEKNIEVSGVSIKGNTASLRVTLKQPANGDTQAWDRILDLKLLKEGGAWKIDRIKGKE